MLLAASQGSRSSSKATSLKEVASAGKKRKRESKNKAGGKGKKKKEKEKGRKKKVAATKSRKKSVRVEDLEETPKLNDILLQAFEEEQKEKKGSFKSKLESKSVLDIELEKLSDVLEPYLTAEFQYNIMWGNTNLPSLLASRPFYQDHMMQLVHDMMIQKAFFKKSLVFIVIEGVSFLIDFGAYQSFRYLTRIVNVGWRVFKVQTLVILLKKCV